METMAALGLNCPNFGLLGRVPLVTGGGADRQSSLHGPCG